MSTRWAALGLPLLLIIDAGGGSPRPACSGESAPPPPEAAADPPPDLDAGYADVMQAADDLVSSLGETPDDLPLLRRQEARLRQKIERLADLVAEEDPIAGTGSIAAPAGPVTPSTAATPEDERARQERATMKGPLPTPLPGEPAQAGAPTPPEGLGHRTENEIREACRAALEQLDAVASRLESGEPDIRSITDVAERLRAGLTDLSAPARHRRPVERPPGGP